MNATTHQFPALGSTRDVQLPEPFASVSITVRLVKPRVRREWAREFARWEIEERSRLDAEQAGAPDDAYCRAKGYVTGKGEAELAELSSRVLTCCLVRVTGAVVGDRDIGVIEDVAELVELLDWTDMLTALGMVALRAQAPDPTNERGSVSP